MSPTYEKLTLGQLIAVVREVMKREPHCGSKHMPRGWTAVTFSEAADGVNKVWVDTKHGDEVLERALVERMKAMLALGKSLKALNESRKPR